MLKSILRTLGLALAITIIAVLVLAATVDGVGEHLVSVVTSRSTHEPSVAESRSPAAASGASASRNWSPREWRDHVESQYRLVPDRRYGQALSWLVDDRVEVVAVEDGWMVTVDGERFDELSEAPDFDELFLSLRRAAWLGRSRPESVASVDREPVDMHMQRLLETLERVGSADELRKSRELRVDVARAASRLLLLNPDYLEIADGLEARAFAVLALAEGAGAEMPLDRSLVAWSLGYSAVARRVASDDLSDDHPWREWLERRDLSRADETPLAVWLRLREAADRRESQSEWLRLANTAWQRDDIGPLVTLLSAQGLSRFDLGFRAQSLVPFAAFATATGDADTFDLGGIVGLAPVDLDRLHEAEEMIAVFRQTVRAAQARYTEIKSVFGIFPIEGFEEALEEAGSPLRAAVLRSIFYGSLDRMVDLRLFSQDNMVITRRLIAALQGQPGEVAGTLARLYSQHLKVKTGKLDDPRPLLASLRELPLGPQPLSRTFLSALERSSWREGARVASFNQYSGLGVGREPTVDARMVFGNEHGFQAVYPRMLDSRPVDRHRLLSYAETTLYRPLLAERLRESLVRVKGRLSLPSLALERARQMRDLEALAAFAGDARLSRAWRARAALRLSELGEQAKADAIFTNLLLADPGNWEIREDWIQALHENGDYRRARDLARKWIREFGERRGTKFDVDDAVIAIIDSEIDLGNLEAALATAQGLQGYTGAAREYRALIRVLLEMKRYQSAREVARALRERYSRSLNNVLPLVSSLWCLGKYRSAAEILREYPRQLTHFDWRDEISEEFSRCFADRPTAAGQAVEQLQLAGGDPNQLKWLARNLHETGASRAAFAVIERLKAGRTSHQLALDIEGYRYRAAYRGADAALQWFESRVPRSMRGPASELIYWRGQHELLWTLVPDNFSQARYRDAVWMLRSMGLVVDRAASDERLERARSYLWEDGETRYADLARLVLGFVEVEELSARPVGDQALVETLYALGVRAVVDAQPRAALRWFRACVSAGERHPGQVEYRWAREVVARAAPRGAHQEMFRRHGADYFMPWGPSIPL